MSVVVARDETTAGHLVFPWPNPLPWGAEIVCAEHEVAIICPNWEVGQQLGPGRHTISPPPNRQPTHLLAYFINVAPQVVPFERYISVVDRATGQLTPVRFFGTAKVKIGNPVLMCYQVVGLPYHDLTTGIVRSVHISLGQSFSRTIAKLAMVNESVHDLANPGAVAQLVSLVSTTNPLAIAVTGLELISFDQFGLAVGNGPPALWPPEVEAAPPGVGDQAHGQAHGQGHGHAHDLDHSHDRDVDTPTTLKNRVLDDVDDPAAADTNRQEIDDDEDLDAPTVLGGGSNPFLPISEFDDELSGEYSGRVSGELSGDLPGEFGNERSSEFSREFSGEFSGELSGEFSDELLDELSGEFSKELSGEFSGELSGDLDGVVADSIHGDDNTPTEGTPPPSIVADDDDDDDEADGATVPMRISAAVLANRPAPAEPDDMTVPMRRQSPKSAVPQAGRNPVSPPPPVPAAPPPAPPPARTASHPPGAMPPPMRTPTHPPGAMPPPMRTPTHPPGAMPPPMRTPTHPPSAMPPPMRTPTHPPGAMPPPMRTPTHPPGGPPPPMHPHNPAMPPGVHGRPMPGHMGNPAMPGGMHGVPPRAMPPGANHPGRVQPTMPGRHSTIPPGGHGAPMRPPGQQIQPLMPGGRIQPLGPGMGQRPSHQGIQPPRQPIRQPTPPPGGRRKTPPLGMPAQQGHQIQGQYPIGSQVLVYWNDGLWHSATIRAFNGTAYQVTIDGRNAVTWVQPSQMRRP